MHKNVHRAHIPAATSGSQVSAAHRPLASGQGAPVPGNHGAFQAEAKALLFLQAMLRGSVEGTAHLPSPCLAVFPFL